MKKLEELCLELKNDIFSEIGENKNWDIIEYTMRFDPSGSGQGGIIILKNDKKEVERMSHKKWSDFWHTTKDLIDITKTNKVALTIYPSGEYESDFIWDNESHLGYLYDKVYNSLCFLAEELSYKITYTLCPETVILWEQTTLTLPFVKGKIQPLQIKVKTEKEIIEHFLLIKDITYEESPWLVEQFEDMYQLTNEGELKGKLSERWNTLVICWNLMERFDLEKHVKFEWLPENEV